MCVDYHKPKVMSGKNFTEEKTFIRSEEENNDDRSGESWIDLPASGKKVTFNEPLRSRKIVTRRDQGGGNVIDSILSSSHRSSHKEPNPFIHAVDVGVNNE